MILLLANIVLCWNKKFGVLIPFLSALTGFIIMYWAPGTAIRQSAYENSSILATIFESAGKLWGNMKEWTNIQYICYVLLLLII